MYPNTVSVLNKKTWVSLDPIEDFYLQLHRHVMNHRQTLDEYSSLQHNDFNLIAQRISNSGDDCH